ncbi:MAG: hypothetical protein B7X28_08510, partial [Halothiobacillus sp. 13-55-253]
MKWEKSLPAASVADANTQARGWLSTTSENVWPASIGVMLSVKDFSRRSSQRTSVDISSLRRKCDSDWRICTAR